MNNDHKIREAFKTVVFLLALGMLVISCGGGGDDPPPPAQNSPPSQPQSIYPTDKLLCINNQITFDWSDSVDPDNDPISYKLLIAKNRDLTTIVEQRTVTTSNTTITLEKAVAYYWEVTPVDNKGNEGQSTPVFAFYTEGPGISNYAPFTAALVEPALDSFINAGTVNLKWTGGDTNVSDVLTYELYFGETNDPPLISSSISLENSNVTTQSGKTYYWKINTKDDKGAKTIGQIWKFNTN